MQADRIADPARLAGTVRGLGVCDVLRVELAPCQRPALARELAHRAAASSRELAEVQSRARARGVRRADTSELNRLRAEARVLAQLRAALPVEPVAPFVLTAPAGLVVELVTACLHAVVERLGEDPEAAGPLEAATAWMTTALDCRAVESFCFEPGVDPLHAR
jgi:hypothetical protein